jgi:hypothetical protein
MGAIARSKRIQAIEIKHPEILPEPSGKMGRKMEKLKNDDMPDPNSPVCQLLQSKLECHMAEFTPRLLKELEDSGQLQEFLAEAASQARLIYLQCRKAGLSAQEAGEIADKDLYPEPEICEEDEEPEW